MLIVFDCTGLSLFHDLLERITQYFREFMYIKTATCFKYKDFHPVRLSTAWLGGTVATIKP
jgi:hypothetical protein